jgi:hypothetical protein
MMGQGCLGQLALGEPLHLTIQPGTVVTATVTFIRNAAAILYQSRAAQFALEQFRTNATLYQTRVTPPTLDQ